MTQLDERPAAAPTTAPTTAPTIDPATRWFAAFEDALAARDVDRAAGMFAATSFWRDLISFTWNITTVENPTVSPTC